MTAGNDHSRNAPGDVSSNYDAVQIAEIGHDLKTYLNPIIGFSSVLLQDSERLREDQHRQVKLIYESARQLLARIDALVELLRLRGGVIKPDISVCNCRHICQVVYERLVESCEARQVKLQVTFNEQQLTCRCDVAMLVRVMVEIVSHRLSLLDKGAIRLWYESNAAGQIDFFIDDDGPTLGSRERQAMEKFLSRKSSGGRPGEGIGLWLLLAAEAAAATRAVLHLGGDDRAKFLVTVAGA
ncbi:MAG: hypothetical protein DRI34_04985 [Deltaproteobacteria bacterium]|nr:MAG: hypothetical protein DRI34_04985 [Deltaproteobacteria bacterium]